MSLEFDIACLRAPCEPCDTMGVVQLIARAKMAADQLEELTAQRDELLAALKAFSDPSYIHCSCVECQKKRNNAMAIISRYDHA